MAYVVKRKQPFYVFLVIDRNDKSKNTTSIEISRNPAAQAVGYKRGTNKPRRATSRTRNYDWRLAMWIGPFPSHHSANLFRQLWQSEGVGEDVLSASGKTLALQFKRVCYVYERTSQLIETKK